MGKKQKKPGKGKEKTERKTAKGEEKRARREARKVGEDDDIEAILVGVLSFPPLSMCSKLGHAWCSRGCSFCSAQRVAGLAAAEITYAATHAMLA